MNLSPADLPKEGVDLPIALGVLAASGHIPPTAPALYESYGELSLGGELRAVRGMLSAICQAALARHPVFLPRGNLPVVERAEAARLIGVANLAEVVAHLQVQRPLPEAIGAPAELIPTSRTSVASPRRSVHSRSRPPAPTAFGRRRLATLTR